MKWVKGGPESFLVITQKVRIVESSNYYFWNPRKISYKIGANLGQIEQKLKLSFFKILFFVNIYLIKIDWHSIYISDAFRPSSVEYLLDKSTQCNTRERNKSTIGTLI